MRFQKSWKYRDGMKHEEVMMKKTAIVTDSNSGITQEKGKELGIRVFPMPFFIDGELYLEDITMTQEEFYQKLAENAEISTSQPAPGDLMDMWNEILKEYEEIVYIPMSSGLSAACENAIMLAKEYGEKVQVVNNRRVSVTLKQSVLEAIALADAGKNAKEIREILETEGKESSIYITVDTLKYLKKGGRITPAAATIGAVLNIKPVLQIQGGKLDAFAKARGWKQAKKTMLDAIEKDMKERFCGEPVLIQAAYTSSREEAEKWKEEIEARILGVEVDMDPLSLSVACHIGPGALAVTCTRKPE